MLALVAFLGLGVMICAKIAPEAVDEQKMAEDAYMSPGSNSNVNALIKLILR